MKPAQISVLRLNKLPTKKIVQSRTSWRMIFSIEVWHIQQTFLNPVTSSVVVQAQNWWMVYPETNRYLVSASSLLFSCQSLIEKLIVIHLLLLIIQATVQKIINLYKEESKYHKIKQKRSAKIENPLTAYHQPDKNKINCNKSKNNINWILPSLQ